MNDQDMERELRGLLGSVLNLGDRANLLESGSPLLGALPELDSMAVAALIAAIEEHFGIVFDDEDLTEDTFATLGALTAIVRSRRGL